MIDGPERPEGVDPEIVALRFEATLHAWQDAVPASRGEILEGTLRQMAEGPDAAPVLAVKIVEIGTDTSQPVRVQKAFAARLGAIAEYDPDAVINLYKSVITHPDRPQGISIPALSAVEAVRETRPDDFPLLVAEALARAETPAEWRKARSILFAGSHSGHGAFGPITRGLRHESPDTRLMTSRWLLPELVQKAQYGKDILDLIEERLDEDEDALTVRNCVKLLPQVYKRRPSQGKRIIAKAHQYSNASVYETLYVAMNQADMRELVPTVPARRS